jgi:hypothetical protein
VPITINYAGTFTLTPGDPSPCEGVPITDTLTGTSSHLGLVAATYPHYVNFDAGTFSGTATFEAANGDELFVLLESSAEDPNCRTTCDVTFMGTITGGTGRFEGAEGTLTGTGKVDLYAPTLTGTVTAELQATINKDLKPFLSNRRPAVSYRRSSDSGIPECPIQVHSLNDVAQHHRSRTPQEYGTGDGGGLGFR